MRGRQWQQQWQQRALPRGRGERLPGGSQFKDAVRSDLSIVFFAWNAAQRLSAWARMPVGGPVLRYQLPQERNRELLDDPLKDARPMGL